MSLVFSSASKEGAWQVFRRDFQPRPFFLIPVVFGKVRSLEGNCFYNLPWHTASGFFFPSTTTASPKQPHFLRSPFYISQDWPSLVLSISAPCRSPVIPTQSSQLLGCSFHHHCVFHVPLSTPPPSTFVRLSASKPRSIRIRAFVRYSCCQAKNLLSLLQASITLRSDLLSKASH